MSFRMLVAAVREAPRQLVQMNVVLLGVALVLVGVGITFIYGAGQQTGGAISGYWARQMIWVGLGSVLMLGLAALDYEWLGRFSWFVYGGSVMLLLAVLIVGTRINGAKSWLSLGPVNLQPSEVGKFGLVVMLAWVASRRAQFRWWTLAEIAGFTVVPVLLIALQPDFGSALVLLPIALTVAVLAGLKWKWLAVMALIGVLGFPLFYSVVLSPHQKQRLGIFLYPLVAPTLEQVVPDESRRQQICDRYHLELAPTGGGWNARQSLLAVGSGGLTGKGFMKGTQNTLGFLPRPVAPTDFIFSVIAEETGFVGSVTLVGLFGLLLLTGVFIAAKARDRFGRFLAMGVATLFCVHIFVNLGMTMGVMPIIGIPLPFLSYGGSFMLLVLSSLGLWQSVYIRRRRT